MRSGNASFGRIYTIATVGGSRILATMRSDYPPYMDRLYHIYRVIRNYALSYWKQRAEYDFQFPCVVSELR